MKDTGREIITSPFSWFDMIDERHMIKLCNIILEGMELSFVIANWRKRKNLSLFSEHRCISQYNHWTMPSDMFFKGFAFFAAILVNNSKRMDDI
ncbi:MAG: hypothetical protein PHI32_11295 [Dysgonamonadaceae bacterium]|nr:hypothetical protein [Dysgonamonadaceae bacterium]